MSLNTDDYAIVVGIDNYSSLPRITGAGDDAIKFAEWLQDPDGGSLIPEKIALILPSAQPSQTLKTKIDEALKRFKIMRRERIGRRLYFYFSGHGFGQYDDIGMFMPEATINEANFNVGLRPYKIFLSKWGFWDEVIFILDCCRDPISFAATQEPPFTFQDNTIPNLPQQVENFIVLATDHGRQAFSAWDPVTGKKRGILTRAILEGLKDQLATDEKGRITAGSLNDYVMTRVEQIAKQHGLTQKAQIFRPSMGDIVFKEGITKMHDIGVEIPAGVNTLIIRNAKLKQIAQYDLDMNSGLWQIKYLTVDDELKKFVVPGGGPLRTGASINVRLIQNGRYAFQLPNQDMTLLDLREVDPNDVNYVFKFE